MAEKAEMDALYSLGLATEWIEIILPSARINAISTSRSCDRVD